VLRDFIADTRGGLMAVAGLSIPVVVLAGAATVEYGNVALRRTQLQNAADNAAVTAARELTLANSETYVVNLAKQIARTQAKAPDTSLTRIDAEIQNRRSWVRVDITETVSSVLGRALTLPSSEISVSATGQIVGTTRLCLLALDAKAPGAGNFHKNAALTATSCSIYSNSSKPDGIKIEDGATVTAASICSAGGIKKGSAIINGDVTTDCPAKPDPLASREAPTVPASCLYEKLVVDGKKTATIALTPGRYCGGLTVTNGAQVSLASGVYVIDNGPLKVDKDGSLKGENVGFYFIGDKGGLLFDGKSTIDLSARKDAPMEGLLLFEARAVDAPVEPIPDVKGPAPPPPANSGPMRTYRIISDNARNLLGTIYLPAGRLIIDAKNPVADRSAYTIIVAKQVELFDGPNLYLNADYSATDVPVPAGVGPTTSRSVTLIR
jgi:Flp pilus assembly protein TadG